jgi:hypothetical protein
MTDIQVKRNSPQTSQLVPARGLDPSRWLSRMMGFDPFRKMMSLIGEERLAFDPAFEVKETKDGLEGALPSYPPRKPDSSFTLGGVRTCRRAKRLSPISMLRCERRLA